MIIVLMGYMGSGKSTIGKLLSENLNHKFLDLDSFIASNEKLSVSELFNKKGEVYFRKIESLYLKKVVKSNKKMILSLGGGTPCYDNNLDYLKNSANIKLIYLKHSVEHLAKRLFLERQSRPLISNITNENALKEFIAKHLFERSFFYNKADIIINCDNKTEVEVLEALLLSLL